MLILATLLIRHTACLEKGTVYTNEMPWMKKECLEEKLNIRYYQIWILQRAGRLLCGHSITSLGSGRGSFLNFYGKQLKHLTVLYTMGSANDS